MDAITTGPSKLSTTASSDENDLNSVVPPGPTEFKSVGPGADRLDRTALGPGPPGARAQRRAIQRVRERISRQRRREKLQKLRTDIKTMEQIVVALPLVLDADEKWDEFLDDDVKRVRTKLRRLVRATKSIHSLIQQSMELHALLAEHNLAVHAMQSLMAMEQVDDGS